MDSYLHIHNYDTSIVNFDSSFKGLHLINVHSVSLYTNFYNIHSDYNNNILYLNLVTFIVIPDGNYSLYSLNKLINSVYNLYRIVESYNG